MNWNGSSFLYVLVAILVILGILYLVGVQVNVG